MRRILNPYPEGELRNRCLNTVHYQKKEDLRKMRSTSSMSDIQNNTDDVKLTYAEMVIKGEQDRTARFEATLAGYLDCRI